MKYNSEASSIHRVRRQAYGPAHGFDERFGDVQAQAGPSGSAFHGFAPVELAEDLFSFVQGYPRTVVLHANLHSGSVRWIQAYDDGRIIRTVFDGVFNEVGEGQLYRSRVQTYG